MTHPPTICIDNFAGLCAGSNGPDFTQATYTRRAGGASSEHQREGSAGDGGEMPHARGSGEVDPCPSSTTNSMGKVQASKLLLGGSRDRTASIDRRKVRHL